MSGKSADKRRMMLINDAERTVRALCVEHALMGRASTMVKRVEVSGAVRKW